MDEKIKPTPKCDVCPAAGFQEAVVSVPVTVTPFAHAGATILHCCGDPIVTPATNVCPGKKNSSCSFVISQMICVEIPVEFGAVTTVGDVYTDCIKASSHNICRSCHDCDGAEKEASEE